MVSELIVYIILYAILRLAIVIGYKMAGLPSVFAAYLAKRLQWHHVSHRVQAKNLI